MDRDVFAGEIAHRHRDVAAVGTGLWPTCAGNQLSLAPPFQDLCIGSQE
ncbi:hypothetical protein I551_4525 [Mycobacterium ulcerans str. Harvey]|uniref:Uncharacterized protein n=1 Tax=Mycobacterium ulcerans str. Harvey TaxID=1299332 RepID=A0ABN0QW83_MYCUL|nr:hypothetical protein I551_4525 [Mycobacterium ulcerans str. Harvey]